MVPDQQARRLPQLSLLIAAGFAIGFVAVAFVGGNLVWLVGCLTSWAAIFFLAVMLQTVLGQRPLVAGLLLTPIYLVMMIGSPLAGRLSVRMGPRLPIVAGLSLYSLALYLLSRLDAGSPVVPDVLATVVFIGLPMALFSAPLATVTLASVGEADQGASGLNAAAGQLASLLGVVLVPAVAGLAGASLTGPEFPAGYERAMISMALLAACCVPLAFWLLSRGARPVRSRPARPTAERFAH